MISVSDTRIELVGRPNHSGPIIDRDATGTDGSGRQGPPDPRPTDPGSPIKMATIEWEKAQSSAKPHTVRWLGLAGFDLLSGVRETAGASNRK
jgi:hypothetical protein